MKWEFIVHEDIENKAFRIFIFQRETNIEKITFWIQLFKNKISLKNSCETNRFDSVCSTESHRSFTFRAYFKKHDSEANLFIENQCLKWSSFEKKIRIWSKLFPRKWDFELKIFQQVRFWNENFSFRKIFENKIFRIIIFQRKTNFEKFKFWIQFMRNKFSMKNSYVKKIVLT